MDLETTQLAERAQTNGRTHITEPLVYDLAENRSYYFDLAKAQAGDSGAGERLERHGRQMADGPVREVRRLEGAEYRVNPSRATGQGGEFAPPLWLNELFATMQRPGQVIQRLAPTFDLPPGVSSVNLPRITTGTESTTDPDNSPDDSRDVLTEKRFSPCVTFGGMSDWSLQALEQSPAGAHVDWVVFKDCMEAIDANVEEELLLGTGKNEKFFGLYNLENGINTIANAGAVEAKLMYPILAKAMAQIGVKRRQPPQAWLMTTGRFAWLAASADTGEQRPLILTDDVGAEFPIASMIGLGVYLDDAIPNTLGAAKEQDTIICCRPSDWVLLLDAPKPSVKFDVLSGSLQVRFQLHRYVAAILGRYPGGISRITGVGMIPASEYK